MLNLSNEALAVSPELAEERGIVRPRDIQAVDLADPQNRFGCRSRGGTRECWAEIFVVNMAFSLMMVECQSSSA